MMIELDKLWGAITLAIVGGGSWLIRRVLTNEKQIALMEADIRRRDEDIKEIKSDIKSLIDRR